MTKKKNMKERELSLLKQDGGREREERIIHAWREKSCKNPRGPIILCVYPSVPKHHTRFATGALKSVTLK